MLSFFALNNIITLATALTIQPGPVVHHEQFDETYSDIKPQSLVVSAINPIQIDRDEVKIAIVARTGAMVVPSDVSAQSGIIATAMQFIGIPYVPYASSPENGFDCSGFIMYVYGLHGISMPHSATAQANLGHVISESEAQPGDLLYWGGHIGFWVSPGMMIDSATEGTTIQFRPIWGNPQIIRLDI
jgi:hypothetical protein